MNKQWGYKVLTLLFVLVIAFGIGYGEAASASSSIDTSNLTTITGVFSFIHGDPISHLSTPKSLFLVTDDQHHTTEVSIDHSTAMNLIGKHVKLKVKKLNISGLTGQTVQQVQSAELMDGSMGALGTQSSSGNMSAMSMSAASVSGAYSWVTVSCRFADETSITPRPISYFEGLLSSTYPGVDHYWHEVSYGAVSIGGSLVLPQWYNLPSPRSAYLTSTGNADLTKLANDCTAAADSSVNYANYMGINLMFNDTLDCCAWGGGLSLTLDGQNKYYSMTWMPPWGYNTQSVIGHEMGHGFGLPHSSGPYGQVYDSKWDIMSNGGTCAVSDSTYGCVGVGTIAYHRDMLGWIGSRKYTAPLNSQATITLERLELPQSTTNYLMAEIPIPNSAHFYTVEARMKAGYDQNIPAEGVVIHEVDPSRREPAHVVDVDNNGDPNDAGAVWIPGETFTDATNKITVAVISRSTSSYVITVSNGTTTTVSSQTPTFQPATDTPIPTSTPVVTSNKGNLALNKTTNVSSHCASAEISSKAVDGSVVNNSKWCGYLANGSVWFTVDLGGTYSVNKFVVKHAGAGGETTSMNTRDFMIQYSLDGSTNWVTVVDVIGNTQSTTTHYINARNLRYIRLYITVPEQHVISNAARIYEFEVYGPIATSASSQSTPVFQPPTNTPVH